jgi:hypothetical protein
MSGYCTFSEVKDFCIKCPHSITNFLGHILSHVCATFWQSCVHATTSNIRKCARCTLYSTIVYSTRDTADISKIMYL